MSVRCNGRKTQSRHERRENQSYFSIASHADIVTGDQTIKTFSLSMGSSRVPVSGAGTCDKPLRRLIFQLTVCNTSLSGKQSSRKLIG